MIDFTRHGSTGLITLNRPEKRNALATVDQEELAEVVRSAGASDISSLVITGNGAFCSGADLKNVVRRQRESGDVLRGGIEESAQGLTRALIEVPIPTIAAVDGPAVGLGFDLALACDVMLVGPDGWGMQGWGRIGAIPATAGVLLLARRNSMALWKLLAEQRRFDGAELEALGICESVSTSAREAALNWAERLSAVPRRALEAYVSLSRSGVRAELPEHLEACASFQMQLLSDKGLEDRVSAALSRGGGSDGDA